MNETYTDLEKEAIEEKYKSDETSAIWGCRRLMNERNTGKRNVLKLAEELNELSCELIKSVTHPKKEGFTEEIVKEAVDVSIRFGWLMEKILEDPSTRKLFREHQMYKLDYISKKLADKKPIKHSKRF
jgi:hypothetical protein